MASSYYSSAVADIQLRLSGMVLTAEQGSKIIDLVKSRVRPEIRIEITFDILNSPLVPIGTRYGLHQTLPASSSRNERHQARKSLAQQMEQHLSEKGLDLTFDDGIVTFRTFKMGAPS
jgi:hypothetical protein